MSEYIIESLNTLKTTRHFARHGAHKTLAEEISTVFKEQENSTLKIISQLATKKDLATFRNETKQDIKIAMLTTIISLGAIMALIEKFLN